MKKTITAFLGLVVCGLAVFASDNTDDPKYMVIVPPAAKAPAIDGKFTAAEWSGAAKLTGFTSIGFANYGQEKFAARQNTEIYLMQDKIYLYCAVVCGNEDMNALANRFLSDQKLAIWSVPRVELFFGNETGNFLQIITDYQGRIYRNIDKSFFCALSQTQDGYIIEYAIPKAVIIRSDLSPQLIKANFNRAVAEPGSDKPEWSDKLTNYSWAPLPTGNFHSVEYFGALLLSSPRELADGVIAEERADLAAKLENKLVDNLAAKQIDANLTAAQEKFPAEVKTYNDLLAQLKKLDSFKQHIADAQQITLQGKYGSGPVQLLPTDTPDNWLVKQLKKWKIVKQSPADGQYACIPDNWTVKKIQGKDYWYMYTALAIENLDQFGIMDVPVLKDGMFFFRGGKKPLQEFMPPDGESHKLLQKYPKPFVVSSGSGLSVDKKSDPRLEVFTQTDLPEKFLDYYKDKGFVGFFADEAGVGDWFPDLAKKMGYPVPKNRKEAFEILKSNYFYEGKDGRTPFRTISTLNPLTRKYSSTASGAHIHHMIMSFGDMMTGQELGETMTCSSVYIAFARGAARQYGKPWRNYEIYYGGRQIPGSRSLQCMTIDGWPRVSSVCRLLTPENRYTQYHYTGGLLCGTTLPMQKWMFLYPYMAGCTIQSSETDVCELGAVYELGKIEKTDPLAINLRDQKLYPSPMLKLRAHFYDNIVKKRDRGVSVTPVGLIFDRYHGYAPLYLGNIWGFFLPNEAEKMMWAVDATLFLRFPGNEVYSNGPYGDIFDVLTNDSELKILADYKVLLPVGDVDFTGDFAKNLMKYVKNGGTLILNTGNLAGNPFPTDFIGAELSTNVKTANSTFSRLGNQIIVEDVKYQYTVVKPAGAEVLAVTADIDQGPVMLSNKYGKGRVILTTPLFLKEPNSMTKMLKLFDHLMKEVRRESLPIEIKTPIQYMVNRNKTGWVVLLCNNFGIPPKGVFKTPPQVDTNQVRQAVITMPASLGKVKQAVDWWTGEDVPFQKSEGGVTLNASLPGGDVRAIEFIME